MITAFRFELPSSPFVTRAKYAISCESRHGSVELRPIALEGVAATMSVSGSCWALPGEQSAELKMFAIVARLTGRISSGMLNKIPEKERLNASRRAATMTSENWFVRTMARSRTVGLRTLEVGEHPGEKAKTSGIALEGERVLFIPTEEHVARTQTHLDIKALWRKSPVAEAAGSVAHEEAKVSFSTTTICSTSGRT